MPPSKQTNLTPEQKKKIEAKLINIFKEVCFNTPNILKAKSESDHISEEIREFILKYAATGESVDEVDLFVRAKEKGLELVEEHDLIFFDEKLEGSLKMRAFLIPGMKIEFSEENAGEKVTEDDLQSLDHELCVSFKSNEDNEFSKLGNLLDIRATLAKELNKKSKDDMEVTGIISQNRIFKESLDKVFYSAATVLGK